MADYNQKILLFLDDHLLRHVYFLSGDRDLRMWRFLSDCVLAGMLASFSQLVPDQYLPSLFKTGAMFIVGLLLLAAFLGRSVDDDDVLD